MTLDEKREQVAKQFDAVVHMARALIEVSEAYSKMLHAKEPGMDTLLDQIGDRSAGHMEILGDILNGMDACDDADEWLTPVFETAHKLWPQTLPP